MDRRLVLVRHAEAGPALVDTDRQLTQRGEREAAAVGRWLAGVGVVPDRAVVSPARRARQTWDRLAEALGAVLPAIVDDRVYDATPETVLAVVRGAAEDVGTLVVVGHNPSVGHLAAVLDPDRPDVLRTGFPPGSTAVFRLGLPSGRSGPGVASLTDLRLPGG